MSYEDQYGDDGDEGVPQHVAELANARVPNNMKSLRACLRCGLIKTLGQFYDEGCENCPELELVESTSNINRRTTAFFEGHAAIMNPSESWAAKWIRVDNFLPGVYAISVLGKLDADAEEDLEQRGLRWRCRPATS